MVFVSPVQTTRHGVDLIAYAMVVSTVVEAHVLLVTFRVELAQTI